MLPRWSVSAGMPCVFMRKRESSMPDKKENGYRYYSEDDIYRLMYILYHRKMNTSLEEIGGLMSGQDVHGIQL